MDVIELARTGLPPLRFKGEKIAEVDGGGAGGVEHNRWHDLAVYATEGGNYVLEVTYQSRWRGEDGNHAVYHAPEPADLVAELADHDPLEAVAGYPPLEAYADKQARLEADIRRRFRAGVTALYAQLPARWFAEEIA